MKSTAGYTSLYNGVILVYFKGTWYTLGDAEKTILEFVEPYIKKYTNK